MRDGRARMGEKMTFPMSGPPFRFRGIKYDVIRGFSYIFLAIISIYLITTLISPVQAIPPDFTVDFSANITSGLAPLAVQFTDLSTGSIISGCWTINNETFLQTAGPVYTFTDPGIYNISHTMTNDSNETLTTVKMNFIIVTSPSSQISMSFVGGGIWGSNPVEIVDKGSGAIIFVGNTSSRNVSIPGDSNVDIRIEKGGLTDLINSPDFSLNIGMRYARENIIGVILIGLLFVLVIASRKSV